MLFDFQRFSKIADSVYNQGNPYSLEECLDVFHMYFQTYEEYMGCPHPPIKRGQIARIMKDMPWIYETGGSSEYHYISPGYYEILIGLHFKTRYLHCDYNINHFFSGEIRMLRWYEAEAGYE